MFGKDGYTLMNPSFLKHAGADELILLCVRSGRLEEFNMVPLDIPVWLCGVGNFRRRSFFVRAFASIFEQEDIQEEPVQFIVEKNFYDIELKDHFKGQGISECIELLEEGDEVYSFEVKNAEKHNGMEMLKGETFNGIELVAAIRYRLSYSDKTNLMQDLLNRYLEGIAWIPYDYENRKEVCMTAFEELDKYSASNNGL